MLPIATKDQAAGVQHLIPVCHFLSLKDIVALRQVNKQWHTVCQQPAAWHVSATVRSISSGWPAVSPTYFARYYANTPYMAQCVAALHTLLHIPTGALSHLLHLHEIDWGLLEEHSQQYIQQLQRIAPNIVKLSIQPFVHTDAQLHVDRWPKLQMLQCYAHSVDLRGARATITAANTRLQCIDAPLRILYEEYNYAEYTDTMFTLQLLNPVCLTVKLSDIANGRLPSLPLLRHLRVSSEVGEYFAIDDTMLQCAAMHQLVTLTLYRVERLNELLSRVATQCSSLTTLAIVERNRRTDEQHTTVESLRGAVFVNTLTTLAFDDVSLVLYDVADHEQIAILSGYTGLRTLILQNTGLHPNSIIQLCTYMPHLQLLSATCVSADGSTCWTQQHILQCLLLTPHVHTMYINMGINTIDLEHMHAVLPATHAVQRLVVAYQHAHESVELSLIQPWQGVLYTRQADGFAVCSHRDYATPINCLRHRHACSVRNSDADVKFDQVLFEHQYGGDTAPFQYVTAYL